VWLFVLVSYTGIIIESVRTPKTLGEESDLEESLATRLIHAEEAKESEHLTDILGKDHLFNDVNQLIVENNRNNDDFDGIDDKAYDNGRYDDNDGVEEQNYAPLGNIKEARTENPIKKDTLRERPEDALKSIGFAATEEESNESVLSPTSKHHKETTITKKTLSGQHRIKSKHDMNKKKSTKHAKKAQARVDKRNPYEELYDEKELKSMRETLVSFLHNTKL